MDDEDVLLDAIAKVLSGRAAPALVLGVPPRIVAGLYALGLDAHRRGQRGLADNLFQRCTLLDPMRAEHWLALAASRQALDRHSEAAEMYQVAGLVSGEIAPVAYAAACFAAAGQTQRARALAEYVRAAGVEGLEVWIAVAERSERAEDRGAP